MARLVYKRDGKIHSEQVDWRNLAERVSIYTKILTKLLPDDLVTSIEVVLSAGKKVNIYREFTSIIRNMRRSNNPESKMFADWCEQELNKHGSKLIISNGFDEMGDVFEARLYNCLYYNI